MIRSSEARSDLLQAFLTGRPRFDLVAGQDLAAVDSGQTVVYAPELLQDEADYRGTLQRWFGLLEVGGLLVLTVPHAFLDARQDRLPITHRPHQKRLYSPATLLAEIEESLSPNSYRLRWLADRDGGYDYALDRATPPTGEHDIALVLERIEPPAWDLGPAAVEPVSPDFIFEPLLTRAETMAVDGAARILALKLDHLGDFLMAIPAMRALRRHFADAHITLVVGSWNEGIARRIGIADELLIFDALPRNAEEADVDVGGKVAQFDALIHGRYDLAIDLRSFGDTHILLRNVDARHKAAIGHRGAHPFLDIFLPVDPASEAVEHAWHQSVGLQEFFALDICERTAFQIAASGLQPHDGEQILSWGPYRSLVPGDYLFQPYLDIDFGRPGVLAYDIAINGERRVYNMLDSATDLVIPFAVTDRPGQFEFRLVTLPGAPPFDFRFYGGKLIKKGASGTLHQSEYLALLVELVAMRLNGTILRDAKDTH